MSLSPTLKLLKKQNKISNGHIITLLLTLSIIVRYIIHKNLPIDSDEITWSIIGRRVYSGEDFHIFFLGQKYMGAIEGYVVGLFQILFGYNNITLRINSFIFSSAVSILIFKIVKKYLTKNLAVASSLMYLLAMSYDNAFNFTKAWGNVPFVSFIGLLSLYLSYETYIERKKISWMIPLINGLLLGLGFFANLQAFYFVILNILIFLISYIQTEKLKKKINVAVTPATLLGILFYLLCFLLFFMLVSKKALINPYLTINIKLGIESRILRFLDFNVEPANILPFFYFFGAIKLISHPTKNLLIRNFNLTIFMFFVGAYFSVSRISVARAAGEVVTYKETLDLLTGAIIPKFIGYSIHGKDLIEKILILSSVFLFPAIVFTKSVKEIAISIISKKGKGIEFIHIVSLYLLIPSFFILSKPAGINSSSRYITSMWPGFAIIYIYGAYMLLKSKSYALKSITVLLFSYYILHFPANLTKFGKMYTHQFVQDPKRAADYMIERGVKTCYAGYWNAYPIMFESKYKVICSPSEYFGYGENETPFNTRVVDIDKNPAFIFTTQKRVDEFYKKWVGKEIKVLDKKRVGKYYIFRTERI